MRHCADFVFATDFWSRSFIYSCNEALFAAECAASTTKTSRNSAQHRLNQRRAPRPNPTIETCLVLAFTMQLEFRDAHIRCCLKRKTACEL